MRIHRTILILTFVLGSILLYCTYSYAIPRIRSGGGGGSSSVTLVSPGSDADSTETDTPSGLELISSNLTLLRGCGDNQILKWDEVADDWNCEDDAGAAGGDSVTVNTTAIDTTANLKDTATVTWAVVDGGAGGPDDAQATAVDVTCTNCLTVTEVASADLATEATALAADPANCASGGLAGGITAAGTAEACITPHAGTNIAADLEEEVTSGSLADNTITDAELATTETIQLPIYSAKLTGAYVVFTPPTLDACSEGAQIDAGDGNWRLLFKPDTDGCAMWQIVLPDYWAAHSELRVEYSLVSATTLEVAWEAAIMCSSPGDSADIGTASFANGVEASGNTVPGTAGYPDSQSITLTDDSCAAGDTMFIVLSTDANDAVNDDAAGNREAFGLIYEFTR